MKATGKRGFPSVFLGFALSIVFFVLEVLFLIFAAAIVSPRVSGALVELPDGWEVCPPDADGIKVGRGGQPQTLKYRRLCAVSHVPTLSTTAFIAWASVIIAPRSRRTAQPLSLSPPPIA